MTIDTTWVGKKVTLGVGGGSTYIVRAVTLGGQRAIVSLAVDRKFVTTAEAEELTIVDETSLAYDPRPCPDCGEQTVFVPPAGLVLCHNADCGQFWPSETHFSTEVKVKEEAQNETAP